MKIKKKICSLALSLGLLVSGNVFALESNIRLTDNEKILYSEQVIINEFDLNPAAKALHPDEEGANLTVNYVITEDITPQDKGLSGDVGTGTSTVSGQKYGVYVDWDWDSRPGFVYKDVLAVAWGGIDTNGNEAVLEIDESNSYHNVQYVHPVASSISKEVSFDVDDVWRGASSTFNMSTFSGGYEKLADNGSMKLQLVNKGVAPIHRFRINSKYGHTTFTVNPSVSFSGSGLSVSISFGSKVDTAWQKSIAFDKDGN